VRVVSLCAALAVAAVTAGCPGSSPGRIGAPERNDAIIRLDCPVPEAEVYVNGKFAGLVHDFRGGMALAPGAHRIVVRHADYHEHYVKLEVGRRERKTLEVRLAERLP
jgi:hypothetical protein